MISALIESLIIVSISGLIAYYVTNAALGDPRIVVQPVTAGASRENRGASTVAFQIGFTGQAKHKTTAIVALTNTTTGGKGGSGGNAGTAGAGASRRGRVARPARTSTAAKRRALR